MKLRFQRFFVNALRYIPYRIRYWIVINAMVDATTGPYSHVETPAVLGIDVLKRMK